MKRLLWICLVMGLLCGCAQQAITGEPMVKNGFLLDTSVTVTIYDSQDTGLLEEVFALCQEYDKMFSRLDPHSEVYRLNHAGGQPVEVSPQVLEVVERALWFSRETGGAYDITICPVVDLWDFQTGSPSLPHEDALGEALSRVDYHNVMVTGDTVTLLDGAAIDLGSIAKGYIADKMAEYLLEQGVESAIINLGGNVMAVGGRPSGEPFRIGVQKPFDTRNETIGAVEVWGKSVVSSGIYERCFWLDDTLYHHILDPATGFPAATGLTSVTIVSSASMDGDALSTACFLLGPEEGMELVESMEDVEAIFVLDYGDVIYSSGFQGDTVFHPAQ